MLNWPIPSMAIGRCLENRFPAVANLRALKQHRTDSLSFLHSQDSSGRPLLRLPALGCGFAPIVGIRHIGSDNKSAPRYISGQHRNHTTRLTAALPNRRRWLWNSRFAETSTETVSQRSSGCWIPTNSSHSAAIRLPGCQHKQNHHEKNHVDQCVANRRKSDCDH